MINKEVYEKFMKRKHIYDTTVSITPDYLVEMILKNKSILTNVNSVLKLNSLIIKSKSKILITLFRQVRAPACGVSK